MSGRLEDAVGVTAPQAEFEAPVPRPMGVRSRSVLETPPPWLMHTVAGAAFTAAAAILLYAGRNQWFYGDEWAFILDRSASSPADLLRPHNEHWMTVPILIWRALIAVFGLDSYLPYLVVLAATHVTIAALVYTLTLRHGLSWILATLSGLALMLYGPGAENLLFAIQIVFAGPLIALLATVLILEKYSSRRADWVAAGLLLVAVMSSGIGLAVLLGVALALLLDRDWGRALRVSGPALATFGVWFLVYQDDVRGAHGGSMVDSFLLLPNYVARALGTALSGLFGFGQSDAGFPLTIVVVLGFGGWATSRTRPPLSAVAMVFSMFAVYAMAGMSRAGLFGVDQATATRYSHVGAVLLLPVVGIAVAQSRWYRRERNKAVIPLLIVFMLGIIISNVGILRTYVWAWEDGRGTRASVEAVGRFIEATPREMVRTDIRPIPLSPDITVGLLAELIDSGRWHPDPEWPVETEEVNALEAQLRLAISTTPPLTPLAMFDLISADDAAEVIGSAGCTNLAAAGDDPRAVVEVTGQGSLRLVSDAPGPLDIFLADSDGGFVAGRSVTATLEPGVDVWLNLTQGDLQVTRLRIDPPSDSSLAICGR